MFIVTHFSIPFLSYFTANRYLRIHDSKKFLLLYSSIVGIAGVLPDLINIHITLTARHNSITHTLWSPLIIFFLCSMIVLRFKKIPRVLIFWIPFAISTHLFLDGISGGIKLLYPSPMIIGNNYINTSWWGISDACFLSLLLFIFRFYLRKPLQKAEQYNG